MMLFVWAALAGATATLAEFQYRRGIDWWENVWWIVPATTLVTYCIYRLLSTDFGWLPSIVLFSAITAFLRIGMAFFVLHDPVTPANIAATIALVGAVGVRLVWR